MDLIRFAAKQPDSQVDYSIDDFLVSDYATGFEELPTIESTVAITEQVLAIVTPELNLVSQSDEEIAITEDVIPVLTPEQVSITQDVINISEEILTKLVHYEAPESWSSGVTTKRKPSKRSVIRFKKYEEESLEIPVLLTTYLEIQYNILPFTEPLDQKQQSASESATYTKAKEEPLPVLPLLTQPSKPVVRVPDSQKVGLVKLPRFIIPIVRFPATVVSPSPEIHQLAIPVRMPQVSQVVSGFLNAQYDIENEKITTLQASLNCQYNITDSAKYRKLVAIQRLQRLSELIDVI